MDAPEAQAKIAELEQLLWQMRDGVIDAAGRARIEALVTGDAAVRRFYVRYSMLCGGLRWLNSQEEGSGFRVQRSGNDECGVLNDELAAGQPVIDIHHSSFSIHHSGPRPSDVPGPEPIIAPIIIDTSPSAEPPLFSTLFAPGGWLFSYAAATVITGMAILGAWAYKVSIGGSTGILPVQVVDTGKMPVPPPVPRRATASAELVGRITGMADCRWADPQDAPPDGRRLGRQV